MERPPILIRVAGVTTIEGSTEADASWVLANRKLA